MRGMATIRKADSATDLGHRFTRPHRRLIIATVPISRALIINPTLLKGTAKATNKARINNIINPIQGIIMGTGTATAIRMRRNSKYRGEGSGKSNGKISGKSDLKLKPKTTKLRVLMLAHKNTMNGPYFLIFMFR